MRTSAFVAAVSVCGAFAVVMAGSSSAKAHDSTHLSEKQRLAAIRRAQVWEPTRVASMNIRSGPPEPDAFQPGQLVTCDYRDKPRSGRSPKFWCALTPDDEVKVKYGAANGEVYAEVAATRLFWALGFPADRMYPVRVRCRGCSPDPHRDRRAAPSAVMFDHAALERRFGGTVLEDSGWSWEELDLVDPSAGGASLAQRDALKLLAVLVQHTDSKAEQQRLMCADKTTDEAKVCEHPIMMVNDLGLTFGRANLFNRNLVGSVNLEAWSSTPVWLDRSGCVGNLAISQTGTLNDPRISESGRKFLADLLLQLTDAQLRDLFEVARFSEREGTKRATTQEWVDAFKRKRSDIATRTCH